MNRPFAYVCLPFAGEDKTDTLKARGYCRRLYDLGYTPIAPHLLFPQFMDDSIPSERKDAMDMAKNILRRCRVLVVCEKELSDGMMEEISLAKRLGIVQTSLEGIESVNECARSEPEGED